MSGLKKTMDAMMEEVLAANGDFDAASLRAYHALINLNSDLTSKAKKVEAVLTRLIAAASIAAERLEEAMAYLAIHGARAQEAARVATSAAAGADQAIAKLRDLGDALRSLTAPPAVQVESWSGQPVEGQMSKKAKK